ncbi:uncharacterized protein LOC142165179 [Nicotiana tabacum]|uniref:Uncharacterized protein LOC142165179 n=1 Tax=Nicotiana tabacum TaxID=4097 RepID=A0AC58S4J7_TOBAC
MDPKQNRHKLETYRTELGIPQAFVNISNKVWTFVEKDYDVEVIIGIEQHLTLRLLNNQSHKEFIVTLVYAKYDAIERIELWYTMYSLASDMTLPWLVGGDFNVMVDNEEKFGGRPVSLNEIEDFRHCINTCNLFDLGFKSSIYTWWNERTDDDCIFKRLYRCLGNMEFQQMLPGLEITHLSKTGSDHCSMILSCDRNAPPIKKSFRFLKFWTEHKRFLNVVRENWLIDFSGNPFILFKIR